jgi:hypothetical protein
MGHLLLVLLLHLSHVLLRHDIRFEVNDRNILGVRRV